MSKYNEYAKKLDETFKAAQEEYASYVEVLEQAQETAARYAGNSRDPVYMAKKKAAAMSLEKEQEAFKQKAYGLMDSYRRKVEGLTSELAEAVEQGNGVTSAEVDANALELLKSGIMTPTDFERMAKEFGGNRTMTRLIGKYAEETATQTDSPQEAQTLRVIAQRASQADNGVLHTWGELTKTSMVFLGSSVPTRVNYVRQMQAHWEDEKIRKALEDF